MAKRSVSWTIGPWDCDVGTARFGAVPSIGTGFASSTNRSHGSRGAHFLELPGVHVVDESAHSHGVRPARRDPGVVQDRGDPPPHVPLQAFDVPRVARGVERLDLA